MLESKQPDRAGYRAVSLSGRRERSERDRSGLGGLLLLIRIRVEQSYNALSLRGGEYIGFSAQEDQRVIPEAVTRGANNTDPILWTMLNSIKEQQSQIEWQQEQIQKQTKQIEKQQRQIDTLEKAPERISRPGR